jgi:hypothetical protein
MRKLRSTERDPESRLGVVTTIVRARGQECEIGNCRATEWGDGRTGVCDPFALRNERRVAILRCEIVRPGSGRRTEQGGGDRTEERDPREGEGTFLC